MIKKEIERLIRLYQSDDRYKQFMSIVREERSVWKQERMMDYIIYSDEFINKMVTLATKASVSAMMSQEIMGMHERHIEVINKAIEELNRQNGVY
jgi:ketopantoate reductase